MDDSPIPPTRQWFPFRLSEVELALGLFGLLATALTVVGVERVQFAAISGGYFLAAYFAGLLVYARDRHRAFEFIEDGGLSGDGYIRFFRQAKRGLLLIHADDDEASAELQGLYRTLLARGVQLRRVIFLREGGRGARWLSEFGNGPGLQQRVVLPEHSALMPFSFVVVDESTVVLSVPGFHARDAALYNVDFVLRHLLVLRGEEVARVFSRMHEQLWAHAAPLDDARELKDSERLLAKLRRRAG